MVAAVLSRFFPSLALKRVRVIPFYFLFGSRRLKRQVQASALRSLARPMHEGGHSTNRGCHPLLVIAQAVRGSV